MEKRLRSALAPVSIAMGRGAEKSGISQFGQHILTTRKGQTDMTHGPAYSPERGKAGRIAEITLGNMGVSASMRWQGWEMAGFCPCLPANYISSNRMLTGRWAIINFFLLLNTVTH